MNARADDAELFQELWAGAMFDIIKAVLDKCKDWPQEDQEAMVHRIIEQLAARYGIIGEAPAA